MESKACFRCGIERPLDDFYAHPGMKDGRLGKCKECTKSDVRTNRSLRKEQYSEYERNRSRTPARKAQSVERVRRGRARWPEKDKARRDVGRAIKSGRLVRAPCEVCGEAKVEAHHVDYSRPLDVRWLCQGCHRAEHARAELRK